MEVEEKYMQRCLDLAESAWPACRPNPMVGACLVQDDVILGEGWTQSYGGPHAEVQAISQAGHQADLSQATLYVTLEPCSHWGKTPPCVDAIVRAGITQVVIATRDPFPEVDGKGIERLRSSGIEVVCGVMESQARRQNRRFFCFHEHRRPYVVLKWAETQDGFIDAHREGGKAMVITDVLASQLVHQWRSEEMAILVGGETARRDSPRLDVRHVVAPSPRPLVWTTSDAISGPLALRPDLLLLNADSVFELLDKLYEEGIQSILVEGGANVLRQFLESGQFDEVRRWTSMTRVAGDGVPAPGMKSPCQALAYINEDRLEVWWGQSKI